MRRPLLFIPLILLPLLLAMGSPEEPSWTGLVSVKGNSPFVFLALTDPQQHQWKLSGPLRKELWDQAQGRWVRVVGTLKGRDEIVVSRWTWAEEVVK